MRSCSAEACTLQEHWNIFILWLKTNWNLPKIPLKSLMQGCHSENCPLLLNGNNSRLLQGEVPKWTHKCSAKCIFIIVDKWSVNKLKLTRTQSFIFTFVTLCDVGSVLPCMLGLGPCLFFCAFKLLLVGGVLFCTFLSAFHLFVTVNLPFFLQTNLTTAYLQQLKLHSSAQGWRHKCFQ